MRAFCCSAIHRRFVASCCPLFSFCCFVLCIWLSSNDYDFARMSCGFAGPQLFHALAQPALVGRSPLTMVSFFSSNVTMAHFISFFPLSSSARTSKQPGVWVHGLPRFQPASSSDVLAKFAHSDSLLTSYACLSQPLEIVPLPLVTDPVLVPFPSKYVFDHNGCGTHCLHAGKLTRCVRPPRSLWVW